MQSDVETVTLPELQARYEREQATARAEAHRDIDAMFDRIAAQRRAEFERLELLLEGGGIH